MPVVPVKAAVGELHCAADGKQHMVFVALFSTVALLVSMAYFFMGSLPLLILKHDTPLDSRFIRGLFNTYYIALMCTSTFSMLCYALVGHPIFSAAMGAIAVLAFLSKKLVLTRMDALRSRIERCDATAAAEFRQIHIAGMVFNAVQLAGVVWGLLRISK